MISTSSAAPASGADAFLSFSWRKPLVAAAMLLAVAAARAQSYSVASCSAGSNTTITGIVYDPAGKNPLPNILVYVPQTTVSAFTDGVNTSTPVKDSYATLVTGNPLVSVTTGADGSFSLSGVPAGTGVPLVIQAGRWRREFVINSVGACTTTALYSTAVTTVGTDPANLTTSNVTQGGTSSLSGYGEYTTLRFARNQNEGDIPRIAFVTGASDALECTVRKVGIDDSEFSDPNVGISSTSSNSAVSSSSPAGRVSLFQRNTGGGAKAPKYSGATTSVSTVQTGYDLFGTTSVLDGYNVLMLPCAGKADTALETGGADIADAQNVASFTNAGGRIFSTHFSSDLLNSVSSISGAANWITPETPTDESGTAIVNQASTDSDTMGQWLYGLNGGTEYSVAVSQLRISQTGTNSPTVNWATLSSSLTYQSITVATPVVEFSYYTPFTASSTADQYGRVFFTDYHVNSSSSSSDVFPAECTSTMSKTSAMSTQEQMLEYSLFQLMNFAIPQFAPNIAVTATASPTTLTAGDSGDGLTLTVANNSTTQPITLDAPVTMVVTLPTGITATAVSATGWTCTTSTSSVTCTLASQLAPGASNTVGLTVDVGSSVGNGSSTVTAALTSEEFTSNPSYSLSVNTTSAISTSTALTASPTSANYGSAVNFTAAVTAASGTASGTVTFYDGGTVLGTSTLNSGTASLTTSMLIPGSHNVTAIYNPTSPYTTSTSTAVAVSVASASTTTTLTAAPMTVTAGTLVSLTAVVTSGYSTPTGTVTFYDGTNVLGTGTLNNSGQATYTATSLSVATHNITAVYGATSSWATSTSVPVGVTVTSAGTTTALSANTSSPAYGSPVTFTASVSSQAGTPSGTVTFYDGATALGTSTLSNGAAGLTTSALIPGAHSVTAIYNAASPYTTSTSSAVTVTVASASTITALTAAPTTVTAGSPVSLSAVVTSSYSTPTGMVTFYDGTTVLGTATLTNGHATYSASSLTVATHNIMAVYGATSSWATSTSAPVGVTVTSASTTTALSASASNPTYGSPVTFTASVSSQAGTPSGTVTFYDGAAVLGTSTLNSGTAALTTSALIPGAHSVTAIYNATSPYTTSTSTAVAVTVASASTTTTLTASATSVTAGTSVSLTAVVASGYNTPTGTVTFYDGTTVLGTATLSNGHATYSTSSLVVATHNITAVYGATSSWATSTSASVGVNVTSASTTTALSASTNNPTYGSPVTFTASVSSQAGTPTGTVTFYDGAAILGTATLSNSAAVLTTSALTVGTHNITAVYGAASSYATSTSSAVQVSVATDATATTLSASGPSVMVGSPVTFTAEVGSAAGTPSGTVTFFDGATPLGAATLSGGTATLTISSLAAGTHNITAIYGASGTYATSTSAALPESVIDLGMTVSGTQGGDTSSTSTTTTVTADTGGTASVQLLLTSQNTALPVNSTLTVTGQPAGTIVTVTGENWQATSSSTWVYPKGYTFTTPTVTFKLPSQLAAKSKPAPVFPTGTTPIFLSLLLLPFMRRGRSTAKRLLLLAVVALSMAGTFGMTGCAAHNGFYAEKSYPVTITLTAGTVSKVSYVTLNVN